MGKKEVLDAFLKKNTIPAIIQKRININSFHTENFVYEALRIGNSIGDILDIPTEIILLEEIAHKYGLLLDTTENAELQSKGTGEEDLDKLIQGALLFESIRSDKKRYNQLLHTISVFIHGEIKKILP